MTAGENDSGGEQYVVVAGSGCAGLTAAFTAATAATAEPEGAGASRRTTSWAEPPPGRAAASGPPATASPERLSHPARELLRRGPAGPARGGSRGDCRADAGESARFTDVVCEVHQIASGEGTVFTERTDSVTFVGSNRRLAVRVAGVFELDEQRQISRWREYWDYAAVAHAVGVPIDSIVPAPAPG